MKISIEIADSKAAKLTALVAKINSQRKTSLTVESFLQKRLGAIVDNQVEIADRAAFQTAYDADKAAKAALANP